MANRKTFTEEQKKEIIRLRAEGKSCDTIGFFLKCGKDRVRRFCKENNVPVGQQSHANRTSPMKSVGELHVIETRFPDFSEAACKGRDINVFFPMPASGGVAKLNYMRKISEATEICSACPIQEKCLDYALLAEPYGIWGGATEEEREFLRMKLNIKCERDSHSSARMVRRHLGTFTFQMTSKTKYELNPLVKARLLRHV